MAKSTYRSIAKANTILGSVQIFSILIGVIRSKLVAILLGPSGVGLMGLFQSTIDLIKSATNMGINTSAVRDIAIAYDSENKQEIGKTKFVLSRIVWITGLLGFCVMIVGAPYLSQLTFGNKDYTIEFIVLSIVPLIAQHAVKHQVILQGSRALKQLASAGIWGGIIGLFINVPLFYYWGEKAIIPALIINALGSYMIASYNAYRLRISICSIPWKECLQRGHGMVKMGFLLGITGLMDILAIYIIKIFIQKWGSLDDVGLYSAGFAIVQQYVNLVFSAISTDYYPRLSAVSNNIEEYSDTINKQFEILILVLIPLVLIFISFSSEFLILLYSEKFISVKMMISWIAFGMIFRAHSWCPGFIFLAKGESKIYFIIYIVAFFLQLLLFLVGYRLLGLTGIGIAFGLQYFIGNIYTFAIIKKRFFFKYGKCQNRLMLIAVLSSVLVILISYLVTSYWRYLFFVIIIIICSCYCYHELDKRLDIGKLIKSKIQYNR